jgi:hypothetical protein
MSALNDDILEENEDDGEYEEVELWEALCNRFKYCN